jgi:transposase
MTSRLPSPQLREQAIALRRAGRSRREIQQILAVGSNATLNDLLRGEPPLPWTARPNAKDDLRAKARGMRAQGLSYDQIAAELGVSKSSVSLWVRDMRRPARLSQEECAKRRDEAVAAYWATERPRREAARAAVSAAAANQIAELSDREILIAGAIAYWCEGAKNKPYRRTDRVDFINSDPQMIRFFLRFLEVAGVSKESLICGVSIHESADVTGAEHFWMEITGIDPAQFTKPVLKRHNPRTVRMNTGATYNGCLRIQVRRSTKLYRQIEGWARIAMAGGSRHDSAGSQDANPASRLPGEDSNLG